MEAVKNEVKEIKAITRKEFVTMWKAASNSSKRKPTYKQEEIKVFSYATKKYEPMTHKVKVKGFLYPEHHILYNIIRGLPLSRGFGEHTDGYRFALQFFTCPFPSSYMLERLYEPFKEGMTYEKFKELINEAQEIVRG
jgi:hypothetical protein